MNKNYGEALAEALEKNKHLFVALLEKYKYVAEQDAAVLEAQRIIDEGLQ